MMTGFFNQVGQAMLTAVLLPLGLLLSLAVVRAVSYPGQLITRRKPLPIVVQPLNFEHNIRRFVGPQRVELLELPSKLRDFISADSLSLLKLAPGPVTPTGPRIAAAAPVSSELASSWSSKLLEFVYPGVQAAYGVVLVPEVSDVALTVGVQVVLLPKGNLVAARSFECETMEDLVLRIGSFAVEAVLEQPAILRRTPRWEQWRPGSYEFYRRGRLLQLQGKAQEAHEAYRRAVRLSPGNIRIALHQGNLYEALGEFHEAAATYDAAHCLWRQNIELGYRLAAARGNHALAPAMTHANRIELIKAATRSLESTLHRVSVPFIWRKLLRSMSRSSRDPGERRFWYSWLRPDRYRHPLRLLRKSKGYEYRCALAVAIELNRAQLAALAFDASSQDDGDARSNLTQAWKSVVRITSRRRSGWLAHWTAACFFSRMSELPGRLSPLEGDWKSEWLDIDKKMRLQGLGVESGYLVTDWKSYCHQRAVGELGRVLRNPCNQLDLALLSSDPDVVRLRQGLAGRNALPLIGEAVLSDGVAPPLYRDAVPEGHRLRAFLHVVRRVVVRR